MTGELVRYNEMCRAIAACVDIDEVKDIRDKALAIQAYAQQAKNTEAERQAIEVRIRAERRWSQLYREQEKAKGAREPGTQRGTTRSQGATASPTLAEMGVSKNQSSRWQQLGDLSDDEFEARLAEQEKPSTVGTINRKPKQDPIDADALWLWGQLRDFDRRGVLKRDINKLFQAMTPAMQTSFRDIVPNVIEYLQSLE